MCTQAIAAQLTSEHRASIRETVISQLAPLQNFAKAHSHPGVVADPYSPVSSQSDRRSAEVGASVDYRRSADYYSQSRPPISPLPPSSHRGPPPFVPHNTTWSPATQIALSAQRGSTDFAQSAQTREQQIAKAAASSFFAPTVVKPPVSSTFEPGNASAYQRGSTDLAHPAQTREQQIAKAAGSSFFAPTVVKPPVSSTFEPGNASAYQAPSHTALKPLHSARIAVAASAGLAPMWCVSRQQGGSSSNPVHRNHAPLHGRTPSGALAAAAAGNPQYTRATRGSFDQPQIRAQGSCDQPQSRGRSSLEKRAERGSFEQAYPRDRSSFDQLPASFRGSMPQPPQLRSSIEQPQPPQLRSSIEQPHPGGPFSFEESQHSLRSSIDQLHAAGKGNVAQLQAAARASFDQLQATAMASQALLGAIPEQGIPNQPSVQNTHSLGPFTQLRQAPGQSRTRPQHPFGQFGDASPSSNHPYSLARASCDYPQPVSGSSRASADCPRAQGPFTSQLDRAASIGAPVSRHSLIASQDFARLDEPMKRRAAAAALGVTSLLPNQFRPEQNRPSLQIDTAGSPFAQMDVQSYQPHALQLHALNTLNAMTRSAQPPPSQAKLWSQTQVSEHHQADHTGFPAMNAAFPQTPPANSLGISPATPFSSWSTGGFGCIHHSRQKHDQSPARSVLSEVGVNASDLQGAWGAHLDASAPTPGKGGSARGQSYNPFLQPQSTFSIREAKLQLQNPPPRDSSEGLSSALRV